MNKRIEKLTKISIKSILFLTLIMIILKKPSDILGYTSIFSEATGFTAIPVFLYNRVLWKFDLTSKIPRLEKQYTGILKYKYNDTRGTKNIEVTIHQTYCCVSIKLKTDEIFSKSITSDLIEENGEYVLYYNYITNPKIEFSQKNPIQIGTCRLCLDDTNNINGIYWTSRGTTGDIKLNPKKIRK